MEPGLHHEFIYEGPESGSESDIRPRRDWNAKIVARSDAGEAAGIDGSLVVYRSSDPTKLDWIPPGATGTVLTSTGPTSLPAYAAAADPSVVKKVVVRIPHASILTLPTVPVELVPNPAGGKALIFIVGRIISSIAVPYTGMPTVLSNMAIRRNDTDYDESNYIVNYLEHSPPVSTLSYLLTASAEFLMGVQHYFDTYTGESGNFSMPTAGWMGGTDYTKGLNVSIWNGDPGVDLGGGDAANYIDVIVLYAEFDL